METNKIYTEDCRETLKRMPEQFINCCVTSPPYYGLRDYGHDGQIGLEETPEQYVQKLVEVFRLVREKMKDDGTLWLNLGDSYWGGKGQSGQAWSTNNQDRETLQKAQHQIAGTKETRPTDRKHDTIKPKDLIGIPWMVAFALRADGWYLRQDIIWHKPNPMPESVTDRCTKSHEYIFLLSKSQQYYYDHEAVMEKSTTFENRPSGVVRNRIYKYDSKENIYPQAYLKNIKGNMSDNGVTRTTAGLNLKTQAEKTTENRNKRSVWTVNTKPYKDAHFATFPEKLIEPCILAGCPEKGIVYDPFMGAATTALVSLRANRQFVGSELNPDYVKIGMKRIMPLLTQYALF